MIRKTVFAAAIATAFSTMALGQNEMKAADEAEIKPLTIGDPARPIDIEHWVKGKKVEKFAPGKVYVLEFWATWCGPCRASMPHITKLQEEYKDYGVTFIGVSDEDLKTVEDFLPKKDKEGKSWSDKIGYTLTTDPDKSVYRDYFKAAGQNGIPTAFIIGKDQHIEWIGHPMDIDKPLDGVVKDHWDRVAFKTQWEKEQADEREAAKAQAELRTAMRDKDWDKVIAILDAQLARTPDNFNVQMQKFVMLLTQMDQPDNAYAFGEDFAKTHWDSGMMLNQIAWFVVDAPTVKMRNLDFAMKLATRAAEVTHEQDPAILDTLARVYHDKGDLKMAVKYQKMAADTAKDDEMGEEIKATLKKYQDELVKQSRP